MIKINDDFVFVYALMYIIRKIDKILTKKIFELKTFENVFFEENCDHIIIARRRRSRHNFYVKKIIFV